MGNKNGNGLCYSWPPFILMDLLLPLKMAQTAWDFIIPLLLDSTEFSSMSNTMIRAIWKQINFNSLHTSGLLQRCQPDIVKIIYCKPSFIAPQNEESDKKWFGAVQRSSPANIFCQQSLHFNKKTFHWHQGECWHWYNTSGAFLSHASIFYWFAKQVSSLQSIRPSTDANAVSLVPEIHCMFVNLKRHFLNFV